MDEPVSDRQDRNPKGGDQLADVHRRLQPHASRDGDAGDGEEGDFSFVFIPSTPRACCSRSEDSSPPHRRGRRAGGGKSARTPGWIGSPHTVRKTVATLISERVDTQTASQQLGHSSPAITREFYISKPAIAADVA